jgi:hypothetical protein
VLEDAGEELEWSVGLQDGLEDSDGVQKQLSSSSGTLKVMLRGREGVVRIEKLWSLCWVCPGLNI